MEQTNFQSSGVDMKPQDGHNANGFKRQATGPAFEDKNSHQTSQIKQADHEKSVPPQYAHIKGWGADLNHSNRPGYPMERTPPRLSNVPWGVPDQQRESVEVLLSNEHPKMTPVFGTTLPPSGLSGKLRRTAFKYSESDLRHWLVLLFADRVNMVEGIGSDLKRGHIPNFFAEMGLKSEFKHNRPALIKKAVVASTVIGLGVLLWRLRRDSRTSGQWSSRD